MKVSYTPTGTNVGTYAVTLSDLTEHWIAPTQTTTGTYDRSSAEWINEAPSMGNRILPLTNFGTTLFGYDNTGVGMTGYYTMGGINGAIGSSSAIHSIKWY